ncbi:hypothetical protein NQ318_004520 [Aromia moschata]|uniref:Transposase n=1 Tax=Aromia moschata TaxID=1265417 RepID=A0AAV8Y6N0_9CUCU|nr:hypothetical protein NQ318_004520 [Aromia moschata]
MGLTSYFVPWDYRPNQLPAVDSTCRSPKTCSIRRIAKNLDIGQRQHIPYLCSFHASVTLFVNFRERGHVRQLKKNPPNKLTGDQKLDVMLMLEENPHKSSRQTASTLNISHSSILRVLTESQMHPYKLVLTNELAEDDFDRRILFCEQMM